MVRIERGGRAVFERAYGSTRSDACGREVCVDTRFDLASLTKVVVATVVLAQAGSGILDLDAPLLDVIPEWSKTDHAPITLRRILAHDAGFASGADYRTILGERVEEYALTRPLVAACGERVIYSDLGFIALGAILERRHGRSLRRIVAETLAPLELEALDYSSPASEHASIPATERDAWRGLVQGTVHDEKAHLMGGVAAHAGLFGDARDVAKIAEAYLSVLRGGGAGIVAPELVREALREQAFDPVARRGLGWVLKTSDENSCGAKMSDATFGHTGFTGTCVWSDPARDMTVVLLTNAVHYGRGDTRNLRAAVCDAAVDLIDGCA